MSATTDKYDKKALNMIRESQTWAYWCISRRVHAALKRLQKQGVIEWKSIVYPYWEFTIIKKWHGLNLVDRECA